MPAEPANIVSARFAKHAKWNSLQSHRLIPESSKPIDTFGLSQRVQL